MGHTFLLATLITLVAVFVSLCAYVGIQILEHITLLALNFGGLI